MAFVAGPVPAILKGEAKFKSATREQQRRGLEILIFWIPTRRMNERVFSVDCQRVWSKRKLMQRNLLSSAQAGHHQR